MELIDILKQMHQDLQEVKEIAIKNTVVLEEHQRRSAASEKRLELIEMELEPIKDHVKLINGVVWFVVKAVAFLGSLLSLVYILKK